MEWFGLDFGTTNSSLTWARRDGTVALCDLDREAPNPRVLRSLLYFSLEERGFVVGQRAIDEYLREDMQGTLMQSIKTFLGDDSFDTTWVHHRAYRLEDLIAVIFQHVRSIIRTHTEDEIALVVGRPAVFVDRPQKERTAQERLRRAAQLAGFTGLHFQYEPIAAGLAYEASLRAPEVALIADFGGGTSDFTVMRLGTGAPGDRREDILASGGVQIAGDTFSSRVMAHKLSPHFGAGTSFRSMEGQWLPFPRHLLARLGEWHQVPFLRSPKTREVLQRIHGSSNQPEAVGAFLALVDGNYAFFLFQEIERAKSSLSNEARALMRFHHDPIDIEAEIARDEFEHYIARDQAAIAACMHQVLERAGLRSAGVQSVFLTGGSAQIPAIRRLFVEEFGAERLKSQDYLTSVASGLGHTAAILRAQHS